MSKNNETKETKDTSKTNPGSSGSGNDNNQSAQYKDSTALGPQFMNVDAGTLGLSASDDILQGSKYKMYDQPQHLEGIQEQYKQRAGSKKIVNFKQDYVVFIRKKLFYAANAASQRLSVGEIDNDKASKGRYMRTYKIDNFVNVSISTSILASGTCSLTIQGAERVMCYEQDSFVETGIPSMNILINGMENPGIADIYRDNNNSMGQRNNRGVMTDQNRIDSSTQNSANKTEAINGTTGRDIAGTKVGNRTFTAINNTTKITESTNFDDSKATITHATFDYGDGKTLSVDLPTEYVMNYETVKSADDVPGPSSGWKFAEKCDWESMDEVWVFGKSNFERDEQTNDFKMNQIFFGYINSIKKTHTSGANAGCQIMITAQDQLKMLELSYVSTNPTMIAGASMNNTGLDLRWGNIDNRNFGTVELYNPFEVLAIMKEKNIDTSNDEDKRALHAAWKSMTMQNIFAGLKLVEIVTQLCLDAGIPTWYLRDRIEPIEFPPFTFNIKQAASDQLMSAAAETRLSVCKRAAQDLLLEFFADEEGNIVLKAPNYALGANRLIKNNMGYEQLKGGLLDSEEINTKNMIDGYWARHDEDIIVPNNVGTDEAMLKQGLVKVPGTDANSVPDEKKHQLKGKDGLYQPDKDTKIIVHMSQAQKESMNASAQESFYEQTRQQGINAKDENVRLGTSGSANTAGLANRLTNNTTTIRVKQGDTLVSLAEKWLGDGNKYKEIIAQNSDKFEGVDPNDLYKLNGKALNINTSYEKAVENASSASKVLAEEAEKKGKETYEYRSTRNISKEKLERAKRQWYDCTLSEMTDALIPEIPQEYIISFTTQESDENFYNMYEVEIIGDHSPFEQAGPLGKIRRVFPDINSMIRFGCRPSPRTFNIPHMGNKENAHVLGYMMCAKSVAERYSGTLSMIDDSAVKIGNPIRFFAYDEHPHKPLASQENGSSVPSAWGNMSNQHNYQSLQNAQNAVNGGIVSVFSAMGKDAVNIDLPKLTAKTEEQSNKKDNSPEVMGDKAQVQSAEKADNITNNSSKDTKGNDLNGTIGGIKTSSSYKGLRASYAAQQTDAQSIYYVSAIRRNINTNKESTMTLSLTYGRMMGEPSAIDQMLLLYKTYYDVNTGYCPQLGDIVSEAKKYRDTGNFKEYTVLAGDTIKSIAIKEYGLDISQPAIEASKKKTEEEKRADKWTTLALKEANNTNEPWDAETYDLNWNRRTGKSTGEFYKVQQTRLPDGQIQETPQKIGDFEIFIYDFDRTKFVYKGLTGPNGETNNGQINKQDGMDYGTYVQNIAKRLHAQVSGGNSKENQKEKTPERTETKHFDSDQQFIGRPVRDIITHYVSEEDFPDTYMIYDWTFEGNGLTWQLHEEVSSNKNDNKDIVNLNLVSGSSSYGGGKYNSLAIALRELQHKAYSGKNYDLETKTGKVEVWVKNENNNEKKTKPAGDLPKNAIKWKSDLDLKTYETIEAFKDVLEQSNIQQLFEELKRAIIALNEGKFGNSLAQTEEQLNMVLTNYIGSTIIIPKSLVLGEHKVPSKDQTTDIKTTDGRQSQAQEPEIKATKTETIMGRNGEIKNMSITKEFDNGYTFTNNGKGGIVGISNEGNKKEIQQNNNNIQNRNTVNAERERINKNVNISGYLTNLRHKQSGVKK